MMEAQCAVALNQQVELLWYSCLYFPLAGQSRNLLVVCPCLVVLTYWVNKRLVLNSLLQFI